MNIRILPAFLAVAILATGCQNKASYIENGTDVPVVMTAEAAWMENNEADSEKTDSSWIYTMENKEVQVTGNREEQTAFILYRDKEVKLPFYFEMNDAAQSAEVEVGDFIQNGKKQLSIIRTVGSGTGVFIEDIYLLNLDTMEEIPVHSPAEDAFSLLKQRVIASPISLENGRLTLQLLVDGQEHKTDVEMLLYNTMEEAKEAGEDFTSLWFGSYLDYEWSGDGILSVKVSAEAGGEVQPGFGTLIGDFQMIYHFDGQGFVPEERVVYLPE